jgi:hypothetical protein
MRQALKYNPTSKTVTLTYSDGPCTRVEVTCGDGRLSRANGPAEVVLASAPGPLRYLGITMHTLLSVAAVFLLSGCIASGTSRPEGERVTDVAKKQAEPAAYMVKPAVATVTAGDFDALWQSMYRVTRNAGFRPDRQDYRLGIFTTLPLVSSQLFEPWRFDTGSLYSRTESSLATVRRTVRWDVSRDDDGTFSASAKVLIERYSVIEHRVTFSAQYQEIFALTLEEQRNQRLQATDPAAFAADPIPAAYWYAIGRDEALEKRLAKDVQGRL